MRYMLRDARRPLALLTAAVVLCAAALPALAKDHKVAVNNLRFAPKEVRIKKSDTVVWTNGDDRDHTVTADDRSFASRKIGGGGSYSRKFTKTGRFKYHCDYHPRMKAVVIVED